MQLNMYFDGLLQFLYQQTREGFEWQEMKTLLGFDTLLAFLGPVGNPRLVAESKWTDEMVSSPATSDKMVVIRIHQK